jgi:hypothetical protein
MPVMERSAVQSSAVFISELDKLLVQMILWQVTNRVWKATSIIKVLD